MVCVPDTEEIIYWYPEIPAPESIASDRSRVKVPESVVPLPAEVRRGADGAVVSKSSEKLFPVLYTSLVAWTKMDFCPSGELRITVQVKRSVSDQVSGEVVKSPVMLYVVGAVVVIRILA